jgi:hypothetical protein
MFVLGEKIFKMIFFAVYLMIGEEKRRRILELWEAGYTKKAIASMASVSVPSVRKYIRESEAERTSDLKQGNTVPIVVRDVSFPPGTRFIVNLELPAPYWNNDPWTCLNNGVPIFDLKNVLGKVIAPDTVRKIIEEIKRRGGAGRKYEVTFE